MYPFQRIVVATDFGPSSRVALDLAVSLTVTHGSGLTLVHAYSVLLPPSPNPLMPAFEKIREAADGAMANSLNLLRQKHLSVEGFVRHGEAWREIIAQATESEADLIVMGTHGHHGLSRVFLGSVAEKVVRSSTIPVLTVRTPEAEAAEPVAWSSDAAE